MNEQLVLYDNRGSTNARKVRFMLAELGLTPHVVEVPLGDTRPDWYLRLHPFGTVPCLVVGDQRLVESNTMLRFLADRYGREDLYPREPSARARVDELLDALSLAVRPALWEVELLTQYARGAVDTAALDAARTALAGVLRGWERLVDDGGYLTGAFSIADIAATARLWSLPATGVDPAGYPRTARMLQVVGARVAFRAAL